ncbi:carbohydrate sulfotransferase 1-like isoform X2 [Homarus americanus]|uniref:carbohydrate sulfotransferase 1-like isoform X2 n=1 Tax=Homarus americanus TaxID=6706 RepID=UPI001C43DA5F|nr:carbohydrate sulfotransferase 1-like isoform X2 [Homarus americanus]
MSRKIIISSISVAITVILVVHFMLYEDNIFPLDLMPWSREYDISEVTVNPNYTHTTEPTRTHQPGNILVLSSEGRSGSSFLGSLVASLGRNMYFFEPIRTLEYDIPSTITKEMMVTELRRIYHCEMRDNMIDSDSYKSTIYYQHTVGCGRPYRVMKRKKEEIRMARRICNRMPVKIIKTIRCRLQWISELLQDTELDLKVIHLVRDPRGILLSVHNSYGGDVSTHVCSSLFQDLQQQQYMKEKFPNSYFFVRYEDLCQDPYGKTSEIFRFLKGEGNVSSSTNSSSSASPSQDIPRCVQEFLHTHMHNAKGNPYSTYRNTATTWQKWRSSISQKSLMTWERECSDVLHMMGHRIFGSVDNARNLSLSLFVGA